YISMNIIIPYLVFSSNTRTQSQKRPKTGGFWTNIFPYLMDDNSYNSFRRHFRITRTTFYAIVSRLETHPVFMSNAMNATPVWKQIAIVLWRLANNVGIRVLEQTLGISQGSGSRLATVTQGFERGETGFGNRKLPNVVGAIDGSHIPIHAPSKNGSHYVNRSVHDARFPGGTYIIADAAYPLRTYLMKAYPDYYMLTHQIYCIDMERIIRIIHACCILHNFCIDMEDVLSLEDINDEKINYEGEVKATNETYEETASIQKRDYLANLLMNLQ
ncbi:6760_t:CDS:2, partial [Scutellospora calospora]